MSRVSKGRAKAPSIIRQTEPKRAAVDKSLVNKEYVQAVELILPFVPRDNHPDLGEAIARGTEWSIEDIVNIFKAALTDANAHGLVGMVEKAYATYSSEEYNIES